MSDQYKPVSCAIHSEYELAIMHNQSLHITWQDSNNEHQTLFAIPDDLFTRDHAEYLLITDVTGTQLELRLDKILEAIPA